jgi:hypothetical protein
MASVLIAHSHVCHVCGHNQSDQVNHLLNCCNNTTNSSHTLVGCHHQPTTNATATLPWAPPHTDTPHSWAPPNLDTPTVDIDIDVSIIDVSIR